MKRRMLTAVPLVFAGLLAITACSQTLGIPAVDKPAGEADQWPGTDEQLEGLDAGSVRLLLSQGSADYFAVTSADQLTACLYKFEKNPSRGSVGGCGATGGSDVIVEVSAPETKMMLVRSGADTAELERSGWTRIHENIVVA